jgi:KTSC domain-containing protein
MRREPVSSSSIAAIGYDVRSEALEVEFVSGRIYRYRGVESEVQQGVPRSAVEGDVFQREH